jgi:hypothetical protein
MASSRARKTANFEPRVRIAQDSRRSLVCSRLPVHRGREWEQASCGTVPERPLLDGPSTEGIQKWNRNAHLEGTLTALTHF